MLNRRPSPSVRVTGVALCLLTIGAPPFVRWAGIQSQRSPVKLMGVTAGRRHELRAQIPLGRLGSLSWPPGGGKVLDAYESITGRDELAVWVSPRESTERDRFWSRRVLCFDEHGCQIGGVQWLQIRRTGGTGSGDLAVVGLDAFPRGGRPVVLSFYDPNQASPTDSLHCFSPPFTASPSVDLEAPLPRARGASCRLEALAAGHIWPALPQVEGKAIAKVTAKAASERSNLDLVRDRWTVGFFRLSFRNQPAAGWKPDRMMLADMAGNRVRFPDGDKWRLSVPVSSLTNREGQVAAAVPIGLCLREEPWQVRARFCFFGKEVFNRPEVSIRSPLLTVDAREPKSLWRYGVRDPYLTVDVRQQDHQSFRNLLDDPEGNDVTLDAFTSMPTGERLRLWARAEDEHGRRLTMTLTGHPFPGAAISRWIWSVHLPAGCKAVRLELAGWPSRTFEFKAAPAATPGTRHAGKSRVPDEVFGQ